MRAVVTGYGVHSAFGPGAAGLRGGVFAGEPGFRRVTRFDTTPYRNAWAAEDADAGGGATAVPRQRDVLLACARAALEMAGADRTDLTRVPLLLGSQGDFTVVNRFWRARTAGGDPPDAEDLATSVPGLLAERLGDELGLGPRRVAYVNACVASSTAVAHAAALVGSGAADMVLCAGAYLVDEEFFAKFDSGRAFASDGRVRPFARGRSGLLLGDGAGAIVVESERHARDRGAEPLAAVTGWGASGDAYHLCRPHPDGDGLAAAMRAALDRAGVAPGDLGYVNAHGTGTPANDVAETRALHAVLGPDVARVPVSSTKSTTGHMLEASGIVEAIVCLVALADGLVPPTAGLAEPDPDCALDHVVDRPREADLRRVLSVNAAFGGANTALVLERV